MILVLQSHRGLWVAEFAQESYSDLESSGKNGCILGMVSGVLV